MKKSRDFSPGDLFRGKVMSEMGMSRVLLGSLVLFFITGLSNLQAAESNVLKEISHAALPGNAVQITLVTEGPIAEPRVFTTDNPSRIAIDFQGMSSALAKKTQAIGVGLVRSVTAIEAGGRTRVVVNLADSVAHELQIDGNRAVISIGAGAGQMVAAQPAKAEFTSSQAVVSTPTASITGVDFRRGDAGEGQVIITLSDPSTVVDMREEGGRILLDFLDASLPEELMRKFDVIDFATPVKMFEVSAQGDNVHVDITPLGEFDHLAYQANDVFTVEFRPLTSKEKEALMAQERIFTGERLSLNFQKIPVRSILQILADFEDKNLVASDAVKGSITLRLKNVPSDLAWDIILKTKGLGKREVDNVIMVAPAQQLAQQEKQALQSQKQIEELAPLYSEYIQINYAKAADIANLLKGKNNQLLTPKRGNVTVDARTNTLLVRDTAAKLEDIRRLVEKLDIPVRQVLIESRVVTVDESYAKGLGVRFGFNTSGWLNYKGTEYVVGGGQPGTVSPGAGLDAGSFMGAAANNDSLLVNLPAAGSTGVLNMLVGKVGNMLLQLELSAMQTEGAGEVIASPRVITSDRNTATIETGFEIPYQESTSSGATSVSFKKAVLKLDVTPQITPDDRVIMDLQVDKDAPDFTRAVQGVPPVKTQSVSTSVLVDNGDTVVLGGVFTSDSGTTQSKVPFFGDLPYLGYLFKNNSVKEEKSELLIFVTPKILKESLGVR
jgi:type IV pilus assembly protein PilQ